jgi:predicted Zn-dependent protease
MQSSLSRLTRLRAIPANPLTTAYPGGYVFVPAALFLGAQDEAEFAGMLAQAMHFGALQVTRGQAAQPARIPLIIIMGRGCSEGQMIPMVRGQTNPRAAHGMVLEADALAVQTMARAGFDPAALVRYIEGVQPSNTAYAVYLPCRTATSASPRCGRPSNVCLNRTTPRTMRSSRLQQEVRRLTERPTAAAPPTLKRN